MPDIVLTVNGKRYAGWTNARVTRGIESVSGGFELSVSERWQAGQDPWPIYEEDECTVALGSTTVITGYVDRRSLSYGPQEHALSVAGRDAAGALVDCSAHLAKWEFANVSPLDIARRVAEPFGVTVALGDGVTVRPAAKLTVDPGDTAFDVIERACRTAGLLAVSNGRGGLVLMRPGSTRTVTELVEGENILAASADFDASGRFRRYVVLGQHAATDAWYGESTAGVKGEATDAAVRRTSRVLVVRPEGNVNAAGAAKRAEWEATVRAARGDAVSITVQGWTQGDGTLWPVNALVRVRSPRIGVNGDMLVAQAVYSTGESGTTTQLTLRRPDAFLPDPSVPSPTGGANYWKEIVRGV